MDLRGFVVIQFTVLTKIAFCDICDLLIVMLKKITCICKITFVVQFGSPALSVCLSFSMSPPALYPLLLHFSIMETLESFTSLLSIMSFKLFPYLLLLTSLLFLYSTISPSFYESCLPPSSLLLPVSTGLWVISIVSHSLLSPSYHQQLVTGNQSPCLASLHGLPLLFSSRSSSSPPSSPVTFLSSFLCQELLLSEILVLRPISLRLVEGIYSIYSFNQSCPSLWHSVPPVVECRCSGG